MPTLKAYSAAIVQVGAPQDGPITTSRSRAILYKRASASARRFHPGRDPGVKIGLAVADRSRADPHRFNEPASGTEGEEGSAANR